MTTTTATAADYDAEASEAGTNLLPTVLTSLRENIDRFHFVASTTRNLRPTTVLDVGCSFGLLGSLLRLSHGTIKRLDGIDWSAAACSVATSLMNYDTAYHTDAVTGRPELNNHYDLVICCELLEHVKNPLSVVRNCYDWTTKHALFSTPVEDGEPDGRFHVRKVTREAQHDWATAAGFHIVWQQYVQSEFCEPHWLGWNFTLAMK